MSPLCRKSNRCAACTALLLHSLIFALFFFGLSLAQDSPATPAVESMYLTLAEPVAAPEVIEEAPTPPSPLEEDPPAPPEPLPEEVGLKPEPKPEPEPKRESKPRPQAEPVRKIAEKAPERTASPVAETTVATPTAPEPEPDRQAEQSAVSALLARLEKEKRYPNSARRLGLQGLVFLHVELDGRGAIRSYRLEGGETHPILQKSALQAMERVRKKWRPVGLPRPVTVRVPLRFELQ